MTQDHRRAKDSLYDGFALVAKAFANGRRAELIDVLSQGERSVEDLAAEIGQSIANTSQHLRTLAQAGLVRSRRDGPRVIYAVAGPGVTALWQALRDLAVERVAEVDRLVDAYLGDRTGLESVSRADLAARLHDKDLLVLDVRPEPEFRAGHISGAHPIPPDELERRLAELPPDVEVVAYCRGPYCIYSDDAVRILRDQGRTARRLEDGYPEWAHAGLPISTGG